MASIRGFFSQMYEGRTMFWKIEENTNLELSIHFVIVSEAAELFVAEKSRGHRDITPGTETCKKQVFIKGMFPEVRQSIDKGFSDDDEISLGILYFKLNKYAISQCFSRSFIICELLIFTITITLFEKIKVIVKHKICCQYFSNHPINGMNILYVYRRRYDSKQFSKIKLHFFSYIYNFLMEPNSR